MMDKIITKLGFGFKTILILSILFFSCNSIFSQSTYYWVGGTGSWSELTHWSTTSGGTIKHTIVPSQLDDVVFDANSFTAAGQTVTVNQTPYCKNFVWNGVTNNPTFNCTGYDLNIFGAFRAIAGSWTFTQDIRALPIVDSFVVRTNITFNKSGGSFTVGKGFFLKNLTSAASIQAINSGLNITTGDLDLNGVNAGSVRFASVTISNGSCKVNNCGPALFNWGNISVPLGSFKVRNWTGTTFQIGTLNISQDSFLINNWDSGSFSCSTMSCNNAKFFIKDWSGTSFTCNSSISTNSSFKIKNWNGTNFQVNSTISLAQDSFLIDNWDSGSFTSSTINCNAAKFHIKDWSGLSSDFSSGSISTTTGGFKIKNWNGRNVNVGTISLAQDSFLIDNWDSGSFNSSTITCSNAKFHIKDWSGTSFYCNSNISTSSSFKIKGWTSGSFRTDGSINANQDTLLVNSWGGTTFNAFGGINCGNARFQLSNWTAGSFNSSITANVDSVVIRNWNAGNLNSYINASAKGILFENWNSGNITGGYYSLLDLNLKNVVAATTVTLNNSVDIRNVVFDNAPIFFNQNGYSLIHRGNFDLAGTGVKYTHNGSLIVYGDFKLVGANSFSSSSSVSFLSASSTSKINTNNYPLGSAIFQTPGTWTMENSFSVINSTSHNAGNIINNGFPLNLGAIYDATSSSAKSLVVTGIDTLYVGYNFRLNANANTVLNIGSSVLKMETNLPLTHIIETPGKTLNDVVINTLSTTTSIIDVQLLGTSAIFGNLKIKNNNNFRTYFSASNASFISVNIIYPTSNTNLKTIYFNASTTMGNFTVTTANGLTEVVTLLNNTFGDIVLPNSTTWTSTAGRTQTMTGLTLNGTCAAFAVLKSNTTSATTFSDVSGTNTLDYLQTQYVIFTGGATWQATNALTSNTTGLTFTPLAGKKYYWIGNAGNWNDPLKWSFSSGGAASICLPASVDTVVFDNNSFTLSNQRVTINIDINHKALIVSNVANNPEIYSTGRIVTITGDATFSGTPSRFTHPSSTLIFQGIVQFNSSNVVWSASSSSQTFQANVLINNSNVNWSASSSSQSFQANLLVNGGNVTWSSSSTFNITGDFSIKNCTGGSYNISSSLSIGDSLIIHSSTLSTFSIGTNLVLTNGSINIRSSNINTFSVSGGSITANNGSFLVQQGAISNFTTRSATFSRGFRIISSPSGNYNFTVSNTSTGISNLLALGDSMVIRNSTINSFHVRNFYTTGGYYIYQNVNLSSGSFYAYNSNIQTFTSGLINVANGSMKFENNSAGNYNTRFTCTGEFLIKDSPVTFNITTTTSPICTVGGNFTIDNSNANITIPANGQLNVAGNFKLHSTCTYNVHLTNFNATTTGKTIDLAGKSLTNVNFSGSGGAWTLLNNFTATGSVNHTFGTFISNGFGVNYGLGLFANNTNLKTLNYTGTDTVRAIYAYELGSTNNTLIIGTAVIKINTNNNANAISFNGNGKTFNDIYLNQTGTNAVNINIAGNNTNYAKLYINLDRNGSVNFGGSSPNYEDVFINYKMATTAASTINISGANTWQDMRVTSPKVVLTTTISATNSYDTLKMPLATSFTFQSNVTQNWNVFETDGTCDNIPVFKSSTAGTQATLNDLNGGITNLNFINIKDIKVTGGTWNASNVIDGGNNTGININASASITYYWIGNGGNWTDPTHWSLSSGGTPTTCLPSLNDDVVFDILSFNANSQTVNVTAPITVRNMTWTAAINRNPSFNPSTLNISGDLKILGQVNLTGSTVVNAGGDFILNQNITWNNLTTLNFVSDSLNNIINFGGKSLSSTVLFNSKSTSITPQWTLANAFNITNFSSGTTFTKGNFISNGYNVHFGLILQASLGTLTRNLNFTGSAEVRVGYEWRMTSNVNTTLNMGTSKLIMDYNSSYITINFYGGNRTYYNVEISKYFSQSLGYYIYLYENNTFNNLNVIWKSNANENLEIQGVQNITNLNLTQEANPYSTINVNFNSNNNQINTINITTAGPYATNININGTGQNIQNYNATHNGTGLLTTNFQTGSHIIGPLNITGTSSGGITTNFQTGTHTIGNVTINGTSTGTITTSFTNGAHNVGNVNITSTSGIITTNLSSNNAIYGNYSSSALGNNSNNLNLTNVLTTSNITMTSVNGTSRLVSQTGTKTHGNVKITTTGSGIVDPEIYANTTMSGLELSEGFEMLIGSNTNLTVNNDIVFYSSCARPSRITGQNQSTSKITKASGTVNINYGILSTHTVTGGASFNATNSTNSNTTGWAAAAEPPLTYYWIGGTGNWNDISKWSLTSGGIPNGCKIPEPKDNVVFDQNSFTASNQFVTLNVSTTVNNMQWSGVLYNPGFGFNSNSVNGINLTINGNLVINSQMRWQWTRPYTTSFINYLNLKGSIKLNSSVTWNHENYINFNTSVGAFEIDMAGKIFQDNVYFNGVTGSQLTLLNNFSVNPSYTTNFNTGKFISNGYDVDFGKSFLGNNTSAKELVFTNSNIVRVRETWEINTNVNNVLTMGTATLLLQSSTGVNFIFNGGNKTYSDVTIQHDNVNNYSIFITGNNTYDDFKVGYINRKDVTIDGNSNFGSFTISQNYDLTNNVPLTQINGTNQFGTFVILSLGIQGPQATFAAANTFGNFISVGRNSRIKFAANITQTLTGPVQVLGTGGQPIFMQSTIDGTRATLFRANDNMCFDYIWIKDINATGGATYLGGLNGVDLGNNQGITFANNCAGYYWVGGSGNWRDVNHWATASGGNTKHMIPPTLVDHVFFDANSFTAAGQTVTLDTNGVCANMNWLSSLFNPTFAGTAENLNIHGTLTLSPNMNITWNGDWILRGTTVLENVDLKGKTITNLIFNANQSTGGYNIQQPITVTDSIIISDGVISTNNNNLTAKHVVLNSTNTKTLNLGSSKVIINEGSWNVQDNSAIILNPGTSLIELKSNADTVMFNGGNLTYNNVTFLTSTSMTGIIEGNNNYNTFTAGGATLLNLESGKTQTASTFNLGGKCNSFLTMISSSSGNATNIFKSSGTLNFNFLNLTDVHAIGGASFNARFSVDNGNNTGWTFPNIASFDVTLSATNATCPIPNNGSITANTIGGLSPYIFQWSNLSQLQSISNLSPGPYSVTVTDGAGCNVVKNTTITQPSTYGFTASATGSTVCFGTITGTVSATAPLGATPLSYLWNNSATTASQISLPAGSYAVTVTDANGCRATASTSIISYPQLTATYSNTTSNCAGTAITFTGLPNTSGFTYGWNFGDSNTANTRVANNTFTNTGNYNVVLTVTDLNSCTDTESKQITIVSPPSFTASAVNTTTCVGCNGFVNLTITGGTPNYTVLGNATSGLCAGTYSYQIRDANLCLSPSQSYTVGLNDLTLPTISGLTNKTATVNTGCTATGVSLGTPTVTDDCTSTANIVVTNNAPSSYPIGVTTIIWSATDQSNNTRTFNQTVTVTASDINLVGNSMNIINNDFDPTTDDNTDFGETNIGSNISKTFNIQNAGTATLNLTSNPRVSLQTGTHFSVTTQPSAASIATGGSALNFVIRYLPTVAGTHFDTVRISSNDCDELLYKFVVKGKVNCSITIDSVTVNDEICPGENNGSITLDATCLSCTANTDLRYSLDNMDFTNETGEFSNLADGNYTVYLRDANNISCASNTSEQTINAGVDNQLPTITCPSNIDVNNDADECNAIVTFTNPIGSDNCSGQVTTQTSGLASGSAYAVGTTTNTFRVTASNGGTAICSFMVTVTDNQLPTITCPSNIAVNNDTDECSAMVIFTNPIGSDNCSGQVTTQTSGLTSGSAYPVGVTTNEFQVTASNSATANCSFTVTVSDNQLPTITCPSNIDVNNDADECNAIVTFTNPIGSDNCSGQVTTQTSGLASGSAYAVGTTTNTFRVTASNGATATCSFTVSVTDNQLPTITCPSNMAVNNDTDECSAVVTFTNPVGSDNCPSVVTTQISGLASGSAYAVGTTTNTFRVTASNGATATCSFTVSVTDNQLPTITCPSNIAVNNDTDECSAVVTFTNPVGSDNCSGQVTTQTSGLTSGSAYPVGVTTNEFQVTASNAATAICSFTITVTDNQLPTITCPSNIDVNNDADECNAIVTFTNPIGSDNCSGQVTTQTSGLTSGSAYPVGVTTNEFQVTASNSAMANCSFMVTVTDNQLPIINCPSNVTVNTDAGQCTATNVAVGNSLTSDNCNVNITPTNNASEPFARGLTTIVWTADDGNGNVNTCSQTVTVIYPEINILGNGNTIADEDISPSLMDDTDFGSQLPNSTTDKIFYIQNLGTELLSLTGLPNVTISGDLEFSLQSQPMGSNITVGGSDLSFVVRYAPTTSGMHSAVVTISNNDCDENNYSFTVGSCSTITFYEDSDNDGFGNPDAQMESCTQPIGYVTNNNDCNDNLAGMNIQSVIFSHDGLCYLTLGDALNATDNSVMQLVKIHADATPSEINTIPYGVTVELLSGTWTNNMMLKNNGTILLAPGTNFINVKGGVYKGKGNFNGNFQNNGGAISPGQ